MQVTEPATAQLHAGLGQGDSARDGPAPGRHRHEPGRPQRERVVVGDHHAVQQLGRAGVVAQPEQVERQRPA